LIAMLDGCSMMDSRDRIVTAMPLRTLWDNSGPIAARFIEHVDVNRARELISSGPPAIVVANVGYPLRWISPDETFSFWKTEARPRIADPTGFELADFPDEYAYVASVWEALGGRLILMLETHH
jgi:hypothetical protein